MLIFRIKTGVWSNVGWIIKGNFHPISDTLSVRNQVSRDWISLPFIWTSRLSLQLIVVPVACYIIESGRRFLPASNICTGSTLSHPVCRRMHEFDGFPPVRRILHGVDAFSPKSAEVCTGATLSPPVCRRIHVSNTFSLSCRTLHGTDAFSSSLLICTGATMFPKVCWTVLCTVWFQDAQGFQ